MTHPGTEPGTFPRGVCGGTFDQPAGPKGGLTVESEGVAGGGGHEKPAFTP